MNIDEVKKQIHEYKQEWQKTAESKERLVQMLNQQERKMEQLSGAISALDRLVTENDKSKEETDEQLKDNTEPTEG